MHTIVTLPAHGYEGRGQRRGRPVRLPGRLSGPTRFATVNRFCITLLYARVLPRGALTNSFAVYTSRNGAVLYERNGRLTGCFGAGSAKLGWDFAGLGGLRAGDGCSGAMARAAIFLQAALL